MAQSSSYLWCFVLLQLACACGDDVPSPMPMDDGPAATSAAGAGGTQPQPPSPTQDAGAAGSKAPPVAGEGASEPPMQPPLSAQTLFPLSVGNAWTFEVTASGSSTACVAGVHVAQVTDNHDPTDPPSVLLGSYCKDDDLRPARVGADGIEQRAGTGWGLTLGNPVEEGFTWVYLGSMQFSWHRVGSVTVPSGTFDACWERVAVGSGIYTTTYCHQIGPVRVDDDTFTGELTALELR